MLELLSPVTIDIAVEILSLPDSIRGYGPVKENRCRMRKRATRNSAADLVNPPPAPRRLAAG